MKFYVFSALDGETFGCETSMKAAHTVGRERCGTDAYTIDLITIDMPPREALRRLLGNLGGYASLSQQMTSDRITLA